VNQEESEHNEVDGMKKKASEFRRMVRPGINSVNLTDQTDTQIIMKVMETGRQTVPHLIIFRRKPTCTPVILFWADSYI